MRRLLSTPAIKVVGLAAIVCLAAGASPSPRPGVGPGEPAVTTTSDPGTAATTVAPTTTTTTTTTAPGEATPTTASSTPAPPPAREARYVAPDNEVEREAKQLACDIAYDLTTYEEHDSPTQRFLEIAGGLGLGPLSETSEPLTYPGRWSRGEIVYPQMGGLRNGRASVMVVTRQTVGSGSEPEFSVVRTLDVRLVMGESGWEFESLASAGGAFDSLEDLALAHDVAADPRIEMPDSARLDILAGEVSPILLEVMGDIADITPYGVTVMATGHPYHVFETNRVSHHTSGRAIDIYRVGDDRVIDDREGGSATSDLVRWLWVNPDVIQVGSPWNIDGGKGRSFSDIVHQDHIHVAVISESDPRWVPAIGDRVWEDLDADGVQDPGEPGIGGVAVRLYDRSGTRLGSTSTDGNGRYEFLNLTYGDYHVEIDIPDGYTASPRDQGSDDSADSDIDAAGVMARTTLDPREDDRSRDAGLYRPASIGDFVWEDSDADGVQDPEEDGIADVVVRLFDGGGAQVGSTTTDDDGEYEFAGLVPGTYHVEVEIPEGFAASPADRAPDDDDTIDSDIDAEGEMEPTVLSSNEHDADMDAGLHRSVSIGDRVWEDLDADGVQDPGEPGIGGVTVRLFDGTGTRVATTTTGGSGAYSFADLASGKYHVEIVVPGGFVASPRDRGSDDTLDSDVDLAGVMASTTLYPGQHAARWDAGLYKTASIGDRVWEDLDGDGIQDPGEPGIGGVTVRLFGGSGTQLATVATAGDGGYLFGGLTPGGYHIEVVIPDGYAASPGDRGPDDSVDSDIGSGGVMPETTLAPGEHDRRWDAGLHPAGA